MPHLLDVSVLIAHFWPSHRAHGLVRGWLDRHAEEGWATCPFTEAALVRVLCNPAFSPNALSPAEAVELLSTALAHPAHCFWGDSIGFCEAIQPFQDAIVGHRQVTDAYLLGLAIRNKGKLATLDRGILHLLPPHSPHRASIELIGK